MREKKWLVYITGILTVLSLIVVLVISKNQCSKLYDIFLAVFGSSILGLIMSLIQYFSERRSAMEKFLIIVLNYTKAIIEFEHLNFKQPIELIISNVNNFGYKRNDKAFDELKSWLQKNRKSYSDDNCIRIIDNAKRVFIDYQCNLEKIAKLSEDELDFAYGNLDFLMNKNVRNNLAYNKMYSEIKSVIKLVKNSKITYKRFKKCEVPFKYYCNTIVDIDKKLFVVYENENHIKTKNICVDNLMNNIDEFCSKIYMIN